MTLFQELLQSLNETLTCYVVFPAIVSLGLYLTFTLRFVQLSKLKQGFSYLLKQEKESQGNITHYQAVAAVLAGNFGTGNISGMAVALTMGGPGALIWMWVMAFLGAAIQYTSCVLGVRYRQKLGDNQYAGGPMYYLRDGLGYQKLAIAFALLTLIGAITVGNFAQVNSVVLPLTRLGYSPLLCGGLLAVAVALVLLGGMERMARLASVIVPIKALLYWGTAATILVLHADHVLPALALMGRSALAPQSALGGILGAGVWKAISAGFDRGLFATDAGTGIVPILQSSAKTSHPVIDGIVTLVAPFLVMVVCTTTGLVLLVTGVWKDPSLQSTNMVTEAFQQGLGHAVGFYIVVFALLLFAYTTILAWACCAEKAIAFLCGTSYITLFRLGYVLLIPLGTVMHVEMIWRLADLSISSMLLLNLIGVAGLSREVVETSRRFFSKVCAPSL